jgi:hypothetical protein
MGKIRQDYILIITRKTSIILFRSLSTNHCKRLAEQSPQLLKRQSNSDPTPQRLKKNRDSQTNPPPLKDIVKRTNALKKNKLVVFLVTFTILYV